MLTAIGAYPTTQNDREGRQRRIRKIDETFGKCSRRYLDISFKKNWIPHIYKHDNVIEYHLNFFAHLVMILYFCCTAKCIYVHSMVNAIYILPAYFLCRNIITDMHGIIVEENRMDTRHGKIIKCIRDKIFTLAERIVVRKSKFIITVTQNMKKYFITKYSIDQSRAITIPIFDQTIKLEQTVRRDFTKPWKVIYAGGAHSWQCIDKMMELIAKTHNEWEWTILSGEKDYFQKKLALYHLGNYVKLASVPSDEVYRYYQKNDFGIILRENIAVNQVACPTKLIEYMQHGLIPIVWSPEIGDFKELGYKYISIDELDTEMGKYSYMKLQRMQACNFTVMDKLNEFANHQILWLNKYIKENLND